MDLTRYRKIKTYKRFLLSLILIALGVVMTVFVGYRRMSSQHDQHLPINQGEAKMSISKFHQIASRNGIKEWRLDARSAKYIDPKKQAILQDISVTFFLKDDRKAHLSADKGILKTESNDIEVSGNVIITNRNYRLKTEKLHYQHGGRLIYSPAPVQMMGDSFQFAADSMSFDLQSNQTLLVGNVEGTLSEDFAL